MQLQRRPDALFHQSTAPFDGVLSSAEASFEAFPYLQQPVEHDVLLAASGCTQVIAANLWITVLSSLVLLDIVRVISDFDTIAINKKTIDTYDLDI